MERLLAIGLAVFLFSVQSLADCQSPFRKVALQPKGKSSSSAVQQIFKHHFAHRYSRDDCFENTLQFLTDVTKISPTAFFLVSIENKGASTLGMVQAVRARGIEFKKNGDHWDEIPASVEKKWYHHVFAMDESLTVYDFDYTHRAKVEPLRKYLEQMFLDGPQELKAKKLEDYEVTVSRADYALRKSNDPLKKVMSMKDFLSTPAESWGTR